MVNDVVDAQIKDCSKATEVSFAKSYLSRFVSFITNFAACRVPMAVPAKLGSVGR